uniref:Thionin Osthi1 n=1 Tax=Oryza sativa subsp. japonica TaxID=39947 RepID=Q5Z554_ORYSJ|nr:putative thionin Osthi1 [Oryza sativa Japonica Group]
MEGVKSLIMCALVLGLVLQQEKIHVEAKSCCPSTSVRNVYNSCRFAGGSREACAKLSTCKHFDGSCQPPYDHLTLHSDTVAANEGVNAAVERCEDACDRFCTNEAQTVTVVS